MLISIHGIIIKKTVVLFTDSNWSNQVEEDETDGVCNKCGGDKGQVTEEQLAP
jgi:hypothetical protein